MIINTKKVIRIANSIGVTIDKNVANNLKIKRGDLVQVSIKKLRK